MDYKNTYNNIINKARSRPILEDVYMEKHHIIPRCMGGTEVIPLTAREHYICHKLLWKMYPDNDKLFYAYHMMSFVKDSNQQRNFNISSKEYEILKKKNSEIKKELYKDVTKVPMYGKKHSEETKKKWSIKRKGKQKGKDNPFFGKKHSEESKLKQSMDKGTRVVVDGILYYSYISAAKGLDTTDTTVRRRVLSDKHPNYSKQ